MRHLRSLHALLITLAAASLLVAACASATPTPTSPIVVPTKAATTAPTEAATTAATTEATTAATTQSTAAATTQATAQATAAASAMPTEAASAMPTGAASAMPESAAMDFGVSASVGDISAVPTKAERLTELGTAKPPTGDIFVVVSLSLQNDNSTVSASFDPANMTLSQGSSSSPIAPADITSTLTDALTKQDIAPSAKVDGRLVYEVPDTALALQLIYNGTGSVSHMWNVPDPSVGTELRLGDLAVKPLEFLHMATSGNATPVAGDEFLIVTLDISNLSTTATIKFDPAQLSLLPGAAANGIAPSTIDSLKDQIQAQDLKPGATVNGVIAFEVPKNGTTFEMMYQGANDQTARWALQG